jgi:fructose-bisphosphate aldolase class I
MNMQELIDTVRTLVVGDKGLLAMDESNPICNKQFAGLGIPQTEETRRVWRELIVTTSGLGECDKFKKPFDKLMETLTQRSPRHLTGEP